MRGTKMALLSPEEEKKYVKERLGYIKAAEKALKSEDLEAVIENFRKIVEVSSKINDTRMVEEFTQKLNVLTQGTSETSIAAEYQRTQMTISDFISVLADAPNRIIKGTSVQISIEAQGPLMAAAAAASSGASAAVAIPPPAEVFTELDITKVQPVDDMSVEEEIHKRGSLNQQLSDLKKILDYKKKPET